MKIKKELQKMIYGLCIFAVMLCGGCSTKEEREAKRQAAIEARARMEQEAQIKKAEEEAERQRIAAEQEAERQRIAAEQAAEKQRQEAERAARRKVYEAQWQQEEEARAADRARQKEHWESEKERLGETPYTLIDKHERTGKMYTRGYLQFDTDGYTNTTEQVYIIGLNCSNASAKFWDAQIGESKTKKQWEQALSHTHARGQHPQNKEWVSVR